MYSKIRINRNYSKVNSKTHQAWKERSLRSWEPMQWFLKIKEIHLWISTLNLGKETKKYLFIYLLFICIERNIAWRGAKLGTYAVVPQERNIERKKH